MAKKVVAGLEEIGQDRPESAVPESEIVMLGTLVPDEGDHEGGAEEIEGFPKDDLGFGKVVFFHGDTDVVVTDEVKSEVRNQTDRNIGPGIGEDGGDESASGGVCDRDHRGIIHPIDGKRRRVDCDKPAISATII